MFDVDKFYLMRKEFNIKWKKIKEIKQHLIDKFGKKEHNEIEAFLKQVTNPQQKRAAYAQYPKYAKEFRKKAFTIEKPTEGRAYRNNKVIDMNLAVLTHETTAARLLNPGGFEPQKRMGYLVSAYKAGLGNWEYLNSLSTNDLKKLCMATKNLCFIDVNTQFYEQNNAAGSILGMFAVQKIAHAVLENNQYYLNVNAALRLKDQAFKYCGMSFGGIMEIDSTKNSKGEYTGKVLGSLVASAADAVKDPVLNLMNINSNTANVLTAMIRMRVPFEKASLLLSQDIITQCLNKFNVKNLKDFTTFEQVIEEEIKNLQKTYGFKDGDEASTEELTEQELIEGLQSANPKLQYKALLAYSRFSKISAELKGTTYATRFNSISNAVGPLIVDNLIMRNKLTDFSAFILKKYVDENENVTFSKADINTIFEDHPILSQFVRTLDIATQIFGDNLPLNSGDFRAVINTAPEEVRKTLYKDRKLLIKLADFYNSYLLTSSGCIDINSAKGLDYYINVFPKEFITNKIKDKYPNNPFIQAINVVTHKLQDGTERFALSLNTTGMDNLSKEKLSSGWEDLFKQDFNLAMKLFKYCFYKGGIGFNPKTFMHLLPNSAKEKINKYKESYKNPSTISEIVFELFVRNNWQSNKLVPRINPKDVSGKLTKLENGDILVTKDAIEYFKDASYCKIKGNSGDKMFKVFHGKNDEVILSELTPLGNNGEYLEIVKYDSNEQLTNTTEATSEESDSSITTPNEPTEDSSPEKISIPESDYYAQLISKVMTEKAVTDFKAKPEDYKQSFKNQYKTWFMDKFNSLGIEFTEDEFDKLYNTLCS